MNSNAEKPTLWVVSELYYPEETSTGYYLTRIAEGLAGDFDVRVICGQPTYSARGRRAPKRERHRDVEIFRSSGTTLDKNILPFRLVNMATLSLAVLFRAFRSFRRGDRVLVVTNPPSMPFICAFAALARGAAYTLLIHDNYPEILIAAGKSGDASAIVRVMQHANRWLCKNASKIIVCGRDMAELVGRKTAGLDVPVETIQNWAELENVRPLPRDANRLLAESGLAGRIVFLYAGNMGYPNDLETIVGAAERYRDDDRFGFIFLGAGVKRKWLEKTVGERRLTNVVLLDPRPRSEQNEFLNACDVALVSLVAKMKGVSVPSRTYNILAAGKPILALVEDDSEVARVVSEDGVGWTLPPGDIDAFCAVIEDIYARRAELGNMGERARESALGKYSVEVAVAKYRAALV